MKLIICAGVAVIMFFAWALCKAAGDADDAMGLRNYGEGE